jgi:cytochrome P450
MGFLSENHQRLGSIFRVRAAHMDLVVLAGPEANEFVHDEGREFFSNRENWAPALEELGAPNTFVGLDGPVHWSLRKRLAGQFSRPAAERHLREFVRLTLDALAEEGPGRVIPFVEFGKQLASRQIGSSLVGRIPSPEEHQAILRYTNAVLIDLSLRRLPRFSLWRRGPRFFRDRKAALGFGERTVREHLTQPDREENFIDAVVEAYRDFPDLISDSELCANGMLPFFAGVDTVGQTIGFLVYEVLRTPGLKQRIQAEADQLFAQGEVGAKALRAAQDIQGAVLEVLRLYPVAFAMPRHAATDFEFQGHRIEKGQALLVFTSACHFLPDYFPEPERFDIDRYRDPRNEHARPNVFAPFGRGPHQCIGSGFASFQLASMLATLMHFGDLELPDPGRVFTPVLQPSLSMGPDFRVRFAGWRFDSGSGAAARTVR